jgi:hypothetical protein
MYSVVDLVSDTLRASDAVRSFITEDSVCRGIRRPRKAVVKGHGGGGHIQTHVQV